MEKPVVITINKDVRYQTIDGFGTCIESQTGYKDKSGSFELFSMSEEKRSQLFDLLFDPVKGAGFNILRMEAGCGCYYNKDHINFTVAPVAPDTRDSSGLPCFASDYPWQWDGSVDHLVDISREFIKRQPAQVEPILILNAWTAPPYMKDNHDFSGKAGLNTDWYKAYAHYLVKFAGLFLEGSGISITHIAPFNETDLPDVWYQGMMMNSSQVTAVINALGDRIKETGQNFKIVGPECWGYSDSKKYLETILTDQYAKDYLSVASAHGYGLFDNKEGYDAASDTVNFASSAGKKTWMSEFAPITSNENNIWNPDYTGYDGGADASERILNALNAGVSAYIDWSPTDLNGLWNQHLFRLRREEDGTITFDISKRYWAYVHYSRFIRPNMIRIHTDSSHENILVNAFMNPDNPDNIVIVVINKFTIEVEVKIECSFRGFFTPYVTNDEFTLEKQETKYIDNAALIKIPACSTITWVSTIKD